jgi:hypothetical protein
MTESQDVIAIATDETRQWLEKAVIGLNLCPFAKSVYVKNQVHFAVSQTRDPEVLLESLREELIQLVAHSPSARDTTLLIAPYALSDFLDFNDFLADADDILDDLDLLGQIQIASFHPDFQFAGTAANDITNCTNRSPYPTLHLIREESIDRAVKAFPQAESIFEVNMQTLETMGAEGWAALNVGRGKIRP